MSIKTHSLITLLQVLSYGIGGFYLPHYDWSSVSTCIISQCLATSSIWYLQTCNHLSILNSSVWTEISRNIPLYHTYRPICSQQIHTGQASRCFESKAWQQLLLEIWQKLLLDLVWMDDIWLHIVQRAFYLKFFLCNRMIRHSLVSTETGSLLGYSM